MRSVMNHSFSNVPSVQIPRSTFDRSHGYKTSFDAGYLVPCFLDEVLPGDTFKLNLNGFARLATPVYPIMDNMVMETFFFAVPIRIIWDNFKKMMGEQVDPGDSIDYSVPQVVINNAANQTLWDYFGIPTKVAANLNVNNLAGRAYNLIWNEWFRDQNLQDSVVVDKDDGPDTVTDYVLLRRGKRHDYFTSALPWLQKGNAVSLPLGDSAPVEINTPDTTYPIFTSNGTDNLHFITQSGLNTTQYNTVAGSTSTLKWEDPGLYADLSNATASTVNELRQAFQVQRLLERDARSGTRYIEILKSHFGVTSPDFRVQRPEYLGGGRTPIIINPIARTDSSPGELGAMGVASFQGHGFVKSFVEHCIVIGLVNVRADLTYQEGLDRMWSRQTRYDFYWPSLAHLGEQAILNKEIYVDATDLGDGTSEGVFGYQERYAEYRYKPSKITGKLRSNDTATLDAWHLGIEFGDTPTLDDTFIQDDPPIDRVIGAPTEPHFIYDSYINLQCTRPMPTYAVPGLIDHF